MYSSAASPWLILVLNCLIIVESDLPWYKLDSAKGLTRGNVWSQASLTSAGNLGGRFFPATTKQLCHYASITSLHIIVNKRRKKANPDISMFNTKSCIENQTGQKIQSSRNSKWNEIFIIFNVYAGSLSKKPVIKNIMKLKLFIQMLK